MARPIRVLLVDDDALVRSGLRMMLARRRGHRRGRRGRRRRARSPAAVAAHRPDVVLMDIRMPQLDGIAATAAAAPRSADPPAVIVLTTFDADDLVLRALQAGAAGFLLKDTPPAEIVRAIRAVAAGRGDALPVGHAPADLACCRRPATRRPRRATPATGWPR